MPIHCRSRKFVAMQVGKVVLQFCVVPFRLSISSRVFLDVAETVAKSLSSLGVEVLMFSATVSSRLSLLPNILAIRNMLKYGQQLGFLVNLPQSQLTPRQHIQWLGMI